MVQWFATRAPRSFIPTIVATMESLIFSRPLDFISEINAGRTSGRRLPIRAGAKIQIENPKTEPHALVKVFGAHDSPKETSLA
jgi:hypothetical protein